MTSTDVLQDLIEGAVKKKIVKIVYKYKEGAVKGGLQTRSIQPVRWELGRFNDLQILAWDLDRHGWRRYSVDNIICILVTDDPWCRDIEHEIYTLPNGVDFGE